MNELIKREDAIKATWHEPSYIDPYNVLTEVRDRIEALPTVDAVPVVRCKDCKHRDPEDKGCDCAGHEMLMGGIVPMPDNYFCADGERR